MLEKVKISNDTGYSLITGGECGIFDLINDIIDTFKLDKDLLEQIVPQMSSQ